VAAARAVVQDADATSAAERKGTFMTLDRTEVGPGYARNSITAKLSSPF
jgi:hypothetical protein